MHTKFKVWHKNEERWMDYQVMLPSGRVGPITTNGEVLPYRDADVAVVFWTGLHDKNGKEIYEGDVMTDRTKKGRENLRVWVVWNDGWGKWELDDNREDGEFSLTYKNWEIIGNIYEHGDLLK